VGYLSEISLEKFRNYQNLSLDLSPGLNIFIGENGQGKTNLLEAIYFLSLLRSFRCKNTQNLKQFKCDSFNLSGTIKQDDTLPDRLEINYAEKRTLKVNNNPINKSSEFIRKINTVSFTPEDIELIKGAAGNRRQFLDILLSQLSPNYLSSLQNYNKALKARNKLLRNSSDNETYDTAMFATYDSLLIEYGTDISFARYDIIAKLENKIRHFNKSMFPEKRKMKVLYSSTISRTLSSTEELKTSFRQKLKESFQKDLNRGITHTGPHRDDLLILLDGKSLSNYGSEGQCRLASLVMKMSSAEQLIEDNGTNNVLLLIDDVLGELDLERRTAFLRTIMRGDQVFIACTEIPEFCKTQEHISYRIVNGTATPVLAPEVVIAATPVLAPEVVIAATPVLAPEVVIAATPVLAPKVVIAAAPVLAPEVVIAAAPVLAPEVVIAAAPVLAPEVVIAAAPVLAPEVVIAAAPVLAPKVVIATAPVLAPEVVIAAAPVLAPEVVIAAAPVLAPEVVIAATPVLAPEVVIAAAPVLAPEVVIAAAPVLAPKVVIAAAPVLAPEVVIAAAPVLAPEVVGEPKVVETLPVGEPKIV
jgi:DNA replication and repair protein RecF